jgi:hypothetical protein
LENCVTLQPISCYFALPDKHQSIVPVSLRGWTGSAKVVSYFMFEPEVTGRKAGCLAENIIKILRCVEPRFGGHICR